MSASDPGLVEHLLTLSALPWVRRLPMPLRIRLDELVRRFLDHVVIDGDGGVEPTNADRLRLAAACAVLYVGRPEWPFPPVIKVTITPWRFGQKLEPLQDGGFVGLAHPDGTIDMTRRDLDTSFAKQGDGYNTALHEFAHQLDFQDGGFDGVPCNLAAPRVTAWLAVLTRAWQTAGTPPSALSTYAGTRVSETFAVAVESFFERPQFLIEKDPELYAQLVEVFAQDHAAYARGLTKDA